MKNVFEPKCIKIGGHFFHHHQQPPSSASSAPLEWVTSRKHQCGAPLVCLLRVLDLFDLTDKLTTSRNDRAELWVLGCYYNSWILLSWISAISFLPWLFLSCEVGTFWWEMRMNHSYSPAKKNDCPLTFLEEIEEKIPIPKNDCHIWSMLIHFKKETWFCESISSIFGLGV